MMLDARIHTRLCKTLAKIGQWLVFSRLPRIDGSLAPCSAWPGHKFCALQATDRAAVPGNARQHGSCCPSNCFDSQPCNCRWSRLPSRAVQWRSLHELRFRSQQHHEMRKLSLRRSSTIVRGQLQVAVIRWCHRRCNTLWRLSWHNWKPRSASCSIKILERSTCIC